MEKLSVELVQIIFEDACDDIRGETARSLGLVSKRFHAIAETFEFRFISVSGSKQLEQLVTRLKSFESENGHRNINIRHLFICDYTKKHTHHENKINPGHRLFGKRGSEEELRSHYSDIRPGFWSLVGYALKLAAPTLRFLSLLSFHRPSSPEVWPPKLDNNDLLSILSGTTVKFPLLRTLVVRHRLGYNSEKWAGLESIDAPLLKELQLYIDSCFSNSSVEVLHPLLEGMHSRHPFLSRLAISFWEFVRFDRAVEVICDTAESSVNSFSNSIQNHVLPGALKSVVIQLNCPEDLGYDWDLLEDLDLRIENVENRKIPGLRVFMDTEPENGKRDYECLLKQWEARHLDL